MTSPRETNIEVWEDFKRQVKPKLAFGVRAGSALLAGGVAGPIGLAAVPIFEDVADALKRDNREEARARFAAGEAVAIRLQHAKGRRTPPEKLRTLIQQVTRHAVHEPIDEKIRLVAAAALHESNGDVASIEEMELADWVAQTPLSVLRAFDVLSQSAFGANRIDNYQAEPVDGKPNICVRALDTDFNNEWRKRFPHIQQEYGVFKSDPPSRFMQRISYWLDAGNNTFTKQINAARGRGDYWPTIFFMRLHNAFVVEREVIRFQAELDSEAERTV